MISEAPDQENPWETPSLEPDLELTETSHRLVALSEDTFASRSDTEKTPLESEQADANARIAELESKNQYLFKRNVALVAKVAEIEVLNRRLSEELIALKKTMRTPWFMRWLGRLG
jgi:molecular chaperone GrpE (heat shock protein)